MVWIVGYPLDSGLSQRVLNKKGFPYNVSYSNTIVLLQWHVNIVGDALTVGQGYRPFTIVCGLVFHVHSWISFIHRSIECRFSCPCYGTGYVGLSIQACFLNSVLAVLSLNSLCQFILCINNLLPQEVIIFGVFYHLFCCLDHVIQSFSMMLHSVILRSFPTFGFLS